MSKRQERLIAARKQQRDEAARQVAEKQRALSELQNAKLRLLIGFRRSLQAAVGTVQVSAANLELLDIARRAATQAERRGQAAVEQAKALALGCEVRLRQVELLGERAQKEAIEEQRRKERRVGQTNGKAEVLALLLTFVVGLTGGCKGQRPEANGAKTRASDSAAAGDAGRPSSRPAARNGQRDAGARSMQDSGEPSADASAPSTADGERKVGPGQTVSKAELAILTKLRQRHSEILAQQEEFTSRQHEVKAVEKRLAAMISRLEQLQDKLAKAKGVRLPAKLKGDKDESETRLATSPDPAQRKQAILALEQKAKVVAAELAKLKQASGDDGKASTASSGQRSSASGSVPRRLEDDKDLARLAEMMAYMKPKAAGAMVAQMSTDSAAAVLRLVDAERAAAILGRVPPAQAGKIAERLRRPAQLPAAALATKKESVQKPLKQGVSTRRIPQKRAKARERTTSRKKRLAGEGGPELAKAPKDEASR